MLTRKAIFILSFLLLALFALSGCGPRVGRLNPELIPPEQAVVDLPALYIEFDETGTPSIGGVPLKEYSSQVGQDLSAIQLSADQVKLLTTANVQHIQLNTTPEGLIILVNGQAIPSLGWSQESLAALTELLPTFGVPLPAELANALPILSNIGTGVVLRFPLQDDAQVVPLEITGDNSAAAQAKAAQDQYLATIGQGVTLNFSVDYDSSGSWKVDGKGPDEWDVAMPVLPSPGWIGFNLKPEELKGLQDAGIKQITISNNEDGFMIGINGKPLPHLRWTHGEVEHLLNLASQGGLLELIAPAMPDLLQQIDLVKAQLPAAETAQISITVNFP